MISNARIKKIHMNVTLESEPARTGSRLQKINSII